MRLKISQQRGLRQNRCASGTWAKEEKRWAVALACFSFPYPSLSLLSIRICAEITRSTSVAPSTCTHLATCPFTEYRHHPLNVKALQCIHWRPSNGKKREYRSHYKHSAQKRNDKRNSVIPRSPNLGALCCLDRKAWENYNILKSHLEWWLCFCQSSWMTLGHSASAYRRYPSICIPDPQKDYQTMVCGHAHWTCPSLEVHLNQNFPRWFCLFLCIGEELISVDLKVGKQPIEFFWKHPTSTKRQFSKSPETGQLPTPDPLLGCSFPAQLQLEFAATTCEEAERIQFETGQWFEKKWT